MINRINSFCSFNKIQQNSIQQNGQNYMTQTSFGGDIVDFSATKSKQKLNNDKKAKIETIDDAINWIDESNKLLKSDTKNKKLICDQFDKNLAEYTIDNALADACENKEVKKIDTFFDKSEKLVKGLNARGCDYNYVLYLRENLEDLQEKVSEGKIAELRVSDGKEEDYQTIYPEEDYETDGMAHFSFDDYNQCGKTQDDKKEYVSSFYGDPDVNHNPVCLDLPQGDFDVKSYLDFVKQVVISHKKFVNEKSKETDE